MTKCNIYINYTSKYDVLVKSDFFVAQIIKNSCDFPL